MPKGGGQKGGKYFFEKSSQTFSEFLGFRLRWIYISHFFSWDYWYSLDKVLPTSSLFKNRNTVNAHLCCSMLRTRGPNSNLKNHSTLLFVMIKISCSAKQSSSLLRREIQKRGARPHLYLRSPTSNFAVFLEYFCNCNRYTGWDETIR